MPFMPGKSINRRKASAGDVIKNTWQKMAFMKRDLVITIDGPAGAGKSTVSKALAAKLSYCCLDTGAFYRAYAYKAKQADVRPDDDESLTELGRNLQMQCRNTGGRWRLFLNGREVTDEMIRTEEIGLLASTISARPCVRNILLEIQRAVGAQGGIVAEGRDMGTVVFPAADFKFYLDAAASERIKRRYKETVDEEVAADYAKISQGIISRDKQDMEREIAPLVPATDAHVIDSTNMTVKEVVDKMILLMSSHTGRV